MPQREAVKVVTDPHNQRLPATAMIVLLDLTLVWSLTLSWLRDRGRQEQPLLPVLEFKHMTICWLHDEQAQKPYFQIHVHVFSYMTKPECQL